MDSNKELIKAIESLNKTDRENLIERTCEFLSDSIMSSDYMDLLSYYSIPINTVILGNLYRGMIVDRDNFLNNADTIVLGSFSTSYKVADSFITLRAEEMELEDTECAIIITAKDCKCISMYELTSVLELDEYYINLSFNEGEHLVSGIKLSDCDVEIVDVYPL